MRQKQKHVVGRVGDLSPGTNTVVQIDGREIVIFHSNDEYFALLNRCPHQGGKLCHGKVTGLLESSSAGEYRYSRPGEIVRCPWHAWEFDMRTGKSWCDPDKVRVRSYPVEVHEGRRLVEGPYVAETFEVSVEHDYIVLHL